jgi:hypothetical protein
MFDSPRDTHTRADEGPVMCFNGANTYQLGWYSAYYVNLPVANNFDWTGDLVGMAQKSAALSSDKMIVRISYKFDGCLHPFQPPDWNQLRNPRRWKSGACHHAGNRYGVRSIYASGKA